MTDRMAAVPGGIKALLALLAFALLCACAAPTRSQSSGHAALELATGERLVVYPSSRCLSEALAGLLAAPSIVVPTADFQDAMYPWFEPPHAPADAASIERLLGKAHVRAKIDELGVRYLIGITQADESDEFPGMFCGAGYGGAGCLGVGWENRQTKLNAVIWDFREGREAGSFAVDTAGTSLYFGLVLPIAFIAGTEDEACRKMAEIIAAGLAPPSGG